jgi:hypothetical protein
MYTYVIMGTSLSTQTRYAAGTREILECFFENRLIRDEFIITLGDQLAGSGAHSYTTKLLVEEPAVETEIMYS